MRSPSLFRRILQLLVSLWAATPLAWAQFPRDLIDFSIASEAILVAPAELQTDGLGAVSLTLVPKHGFFFAPTPINLYLYKDDAQIAHLATGFGTGTGKQLLTFEVPDVAPGNYTLRAQIFGVAEPLAAQVKVSHTPAILLETDKPIYKPGQTVHGRVLLVDNALRPSDGQVEVSFHDAKGIRIDRRMLTTNTFGIASFDLDLASELNNGVWSIRATAGGASSSRDIRVETYVLPKYEITTTFHRSWVLVDEAISGNVTAAYFFGRPVAGTATITAKRYVGIWETFAEVTGNLTDGRLDFEMPAAGFAAGTPGANGLGSLTFDVAITDSAGHSQTTTELLTVSPAEVVVRLVPLVAKFKPGMDAPVLLVTETPDGEARDLTVAYRAEYSSGFQGYLGSESATVKTVEGRIRLYLSIPENTTVIQLTASVNGEEEHRFTTTQTLTADYSPTSSFLSLRRIGPNRPVAAGEEALLEALATHPGTTYYDVYANGRTIFSGASREPTISFTVTPEMAPRVRVVAYKINPNNEIAADSISLDVALPDGLPVSVSLDVANPKPGDRVTLSVDTGHPAMVGLAIVDQSVLALGKSRLHLGDVFAELDRRFMEPQIEIHDEPAFQPLDFRASSEIFKQANLVIATTPGLHLPSVADLEIDLGGLPERSDDQLDSSAPDATAVRVRQFFPETWLWLPDLVTDGEGKASLELTVPDSITGWEISAVASSAEGLGFSRGETTVFQEFFVEPNLPAAVTRGEEFPIAVSIYNYLDEPQEVALHFGAEAWFELLGEENTTLTVPANAVVAAHFPIRPLVAGEHMVKVTAIGSRLSDAVLRPLKVVPEGIPVEEVENGVIVAGTQVSLVGGLPERAVADSGRAFLHIIPSPLAHTMQGIDGLLNMPFGCGEQNMIFLAPDIEILRYLNATGEVMPQVRAKAEYYINVGYQRQLTFQTSDGGFAAFGGHRGSLWLTAFVLSTFSAAREVRDIDEKVLDAAAAMLLARQNPDGSFQTDDFLIHTEMAGGVENTFTMAAYTAAALADYGAEDVIAALPITGAYLAGMLDEVADQPYPLAIGALALAKIDGFEQQAQAALDTLLGRADRDDTGIHWDPYPVETTGYALMALLLLDRPEAAEAAEWLATQRNALGGYGGSTQDTVVAIRALTAAALEVRGSLDLDLVVQAGETTLANLHLDAANYDLLQTIPLPQETGEWRIEAQGTGATGFQVVRRYNTPNDQPPVPSDMQLAVDYDTSGVETDDLVDVTVTLTYTGSKQQTGMVIVDVGIPTGFDVQRATLDELVKEGVLSRVETAGRKIICYIDTLLRDQPLRFSFQVRALYPVRAQPQLARAYEYYDPSVQAAVIMPGLEISAAH